MPSVIYQCDQNIIAPSCDPCMTAVEQGRVRGVIFFHKDIYNTIKLQPTDANTWAQALHDGDAFVIPETQGSFDGGAPVEVTGYGDVGTKIVGYNFTLSYKDPSFIQNCGFYNTIKGSTNWHIAFRTETQTRISSRPVAILPKSPVEEDINSEVVWDIEVKWNEKDQPCPFDTPAGIFTCTPIEPTPVADFDFYFGYGTIPTDEDEVENGSQDSAPHLSNPTVSDFGNNGGDEVLWYAEPITEPVKVKWYHTAINNGAIGPLETWLSPIIVGQYRVYKTSFATTYSTPTSVEFRTS